MEAAGAALADNAGAARLRLAGGIESGTAWLAAADEGCAAIVFGCAAGCVAAGVDGAAETVTVTVTAGDAAGAEAAGTTGAED